MLRGGGAVDEFVDALAALDAALDDVDYGFVAEEVAAFGVGDVASVEEEDGVGGAGVDVESAGLVSVAEHLENAGKIVVREAAAEAGVGLSEHLRRLKAFGFADDDVANVSGDDRGRARAVDVVVAAGLEGFHESALAAVAESDDGERGVFGIGVNDFGDFESAHFAHVGGADDGGGRVVFERGQREGGLRAGLNVEAFFFQRVAEALGEIDVAVDQQNFCGAAGRS